MCDYNLEMEGGLSSVMLEYNCTSNQIPCIQWRSRASNKRAVKMTNAGQFVYYEITSLYECSLQITNVVHSNDGNSDIVGIIIYQLNDSNEVINGIEIGEFNTSDDLYGDGSLWDRFVSSNQVGEEEILPPGKFRITVIAIATNHVELDTLEFSVTCDRKGAKCPVVYPMQSVISDDSLSTVSIALLIVLSFLVIALILINIIFVGCIIKIKCCPPNPGREHDNIAWHDME